MRIYFSAVVLVALCGCTAQGGPLEEVQDAVANLVLPPEQADQLGERMAQEIEAKQPLAQDPQMQSRVARVGQQVLAAADDVPEGYDFSFKVIQAPDTLNAFALPGGEIYVTSGLMQAADTDAQLSAVLGHEVAHVTQRHIADRLATQYGVQLLASAALGQNPGAITQMVTSLVQKGALMKYSRTQELQADEVGVGYMQEAGYEPQAAITMFRKLGADGGQQAPAFLSSHPAIDERIDRLQEMIASN